MIDDSLIERLQKLPRPEPSAGNLAYEGERTQAFATRSECLANYEKYKSADRTAPVTYLPIKLDIENVSRCNFRCSMCTVSEWPKGKRGEDMSLQSFKALIDEQYGLVEIKLQGLGEPLLAGDDVFEMIRYARARHIWVRTTSNASLFHLRDNGQKLIDADTNEIQISIDGADEVTFTSIRKGADFERVLDNCLKINRYAQKKGLSRTKMWSTIQTTNVDQMEDLLELAVKLQFPSMAFGMDLESSGLEAWETKLSSQRVVLDHIFLDRAEALVERAKELGISLGFWKTMQRFSSASSTTVCNWPFERGYVSSDLRAVPCCMISNPDVSELGRIEPDRGYSDIWLGSTYAQFRQDHLNGNIPAICADCYDKDAS